MTAGPCNPGVPPICKESQDRVEPCALSFYIIREPSAIVQRQTLCGNGPDVILGAAQHVRVTVSGCLAHVLRADVNPLLTSIPWT